MRERDPDRVFEGEEIDLRGQKIDPDIFRRVGENIVLKVRSRGVPSPQVVLGGDTRNDTMALMEALSRGILNRSGSIILIGGDIAKPIAYFAGELYEADAVAYVTASHVRASYNGLKVCFTEKPPYTEPVLPLAAREVVNKREDVVREYQQYLLGRFDPELGKGKSLVVDPLFATGRLIAPDVLRKARFDLETLHCYIDRKFILLHDNAPDPTLRENLEELCEVVKAWRGIGVAFDGDMDRSVFVDENGEIVPSDEIAMIMAKHILKKVRKKAKIVYHCQCSNGVPEVIEEARGAPVSQETGWRSIKEKMKEVGAAFGAEVSGHFFYGRDLYYVPNGDDGLFTALMLCSVLKESKQTLAEARRELPAYFTSPELRVTYNEDRNIQVVEALKKRFSEDKSFVLSTIGQDLKAEKHDSQQWHSWVVFRVSQTEPQKLSFRFEGRTLEHLAEIKRTLFDSIPDEDQPLRKMLEESYASAVGDPTAYYRRALETSGHLPPGAPSGSPG